LQGFSLNARGDRVNKASKDNLKGFSLIELVFIVAIVGVIASIGLTKFSIKEKLCYIELANELSNIQYKLSIIYTNLSLSQQEPNKNQILSLISSSSVNKKDCFLGFHQSKLIAKAFDKTTTFSIEPSDVSIQPSFKCAFSSNVLCREILSRTKIR